MYEDEAEQVNITAPQRHDRWSVLIVGLNWITQLANANYVALDQCTMMAAQHANQKKYDDKFGVLTEPVRIWGA